MLEFADVALCVYIPLSFYIYHFGEDRSNPLEEWLYVELFNKYEGNCYIDEIASFWPSNERRADNEQSPSPRKLEISMMMHKNQFHFVVFI